MQKKKTLSDASHATISTSAPTERQKLPKSQEGEKEDKKGEKEAVKGSGGGGALELVFFSLVAICAKKSKNPTTSVPPDSASIPQIGSRGQAEMVRLPSL